MLPLLSHFPHVDIAVTWIPSSPYLLLLGDEMADGTHSEYEVR